MDLPIKIIFIIVAIVVGAFLFIVIPQEIDRSDRSREIAEKMGCVYIGHARDLNSIRFFDCDGVIKMERIK